MKSILTITCCFFLLITVSNAQHKQWCVYKSADEFINAKPYVCVNCEGNRTGVRISDFFLRPYIYVYADTGTFKIEVDSIYAVKCGNGKCYRIWNQKAYLMEETGDVIIYSISNKRNMVHHTPRGCRSRRSLITTFYFSKTFNSPVILLTRNNVQRILKFDEKQEMLFFEKFPDDASLCNRSNNHYVINQFFKQHLK